jgi:general secretion pathway protein D
VADIVTEKSSSTGAQVIDFKSLTDLIRTTVSPETWTSSGLGEGNVQPDPVNLSLIVVQTDDVHQQIAAMLGALRRAQRAASAIE